MAAADTAKLVASLTLDAKGFQRGVASAQKSLGGLEGTVGNIGRKAADGVKSFSKNVALIGVAAAGVIAVGVKSGLDNLAKLETAVTSVDGAIEQLGLQGEVTGEQVAKWANDIERNVQAAFDDKDITAAAATLLRFGRVVPDNLKQSLEVMTDLAAKTGDVESASTLLAKVLADPGKAAGKLAKQGIILSKAQQKVIDGFIEQNDLAGAQKFILDELAKTTGGAAVASQGKYADAINILNDVVEDAQKALATGFLPLIEKVADKLSTAMADPAFIRGLEDFGTTLAGGLDDLISVAEKLPWGTIGESLKLAGAGAKTLLDAFVALPPWVQTAVITGWGLNKLTGGALGGIVAELGKGLIKGVLGINAGVVNINAATVNGAGGLPGTGPAGPGTSTAGKIGAGVTAVAGATVLITAETVAKGVQEGFAQFIGGTPLEVEIAGRLPSGLNLTGPLERLQRALSGDFRSDLEVLQDLEREQNTKTGLTNQHLAEQLAKSPTATAQNITNERLEAIGSTTSAQQQSVSSLLASSERNEAIGNASQVKGQQDAFAIRDAVNGKVGLLGTITQGVKTAVDATTSASREAGRTAAAAIRDKDLSVSVATTNVINNVVSVRETIKTQTTYKQYSKFNT